MKNSCKKKLNILGILPHSIGGRLTASSIFDGFAANGHVVKRFDEIYDPNEKLTVLLKNNMFDFIVGYDFSALKLKIENNINSKVINYFSDEIDKPTAGEGYKELYEHLNDDGVYSFYWDFALTEKERKNIKNIFYMPHFVNENVYYPQNPGGGGAFAGRLDSDFRLNLWLELVKSFPRAKFSWYAIEKHYKDALVRADNEGKKLLEKTYCGFLSTEQEMAAALNKTKIVINMHSQGVGSFNYRTFQALACGRVLISDERSEADYLFPHNEVIFYKNFEDLKTKVGYWLSETEEYKRQAGFARNCIVNNYSAKSKAAEMLDKICKVNN